MYDEQLITWQGIWKKVSSFFRFIVLYRVHPEHTNETVEHNQNCLNQVLTFTDDSMR